MKYSRQRGTKDILPSEIKIWQYIEATAKRVFELYNYAEIRTPIFEQTELFTRSIGNTTDIVSKEMYDFIDKGGRAITLRPEETAPVVRAVIENNLLGQNELVKLYYIGPMFRYERPQAGRFRQFHQAGVEVFGSGDPLMDVEVIDLGLNYLKEIGVTDLEVDISSVGCPKCREAIKKELKDYFKSKLSSLCENCQKRFETNALRILDCKEEKCQSAIKNAPSSIDSLCEYCRSQFDSVVQYLKKFEIKYNISKRLVRGLDYYTGTTFEIVSKALGAQNAICGGGRYDNLVEELGGRSTPAVGFAIGLDRLIMILEERKIKASEEQRLKVYIATMGDAAKQKGFEVLKNLRNMGVKCDMDYQGKGLNSQLKTADKLGAQFTIIIGDDELKNGLAVVKSMDNKTQESVEFKKILEKIK
jgi:histidyl-tRNA synthetase